MGREHSYGIERAIALSIVFGLGSVSSVCPTNWKHSDRVFCYCYILCSVSLVVLDELKALALDL